MEVGLLESLFDDPRFINPLERYFDDPSFASQWSLPFAMLGDRDGGKDATIFRNETELSAIRATARLLAAECPPAVGALEALTNFIIRTGFNYSVVAEKDATAPAGLVRALQRVLDEFLDESDWVVDLERELFVRSRRDGEFFLALTAMDDGRTAVRVIEPEMVTEPDPIPPAGRSRSFGIETDSDDVQTRFGYWVQWNTVDAPDFLKADRIEHYKINTDRNIKRGVSDFYAVRKFLSKADKLVLNTAIGGAIQAAIAYIVEHAPTTTQAQVESLRSASADYTFNRPTQNQGTKLQFAERFIPGTKLQVRSGQKYLPGPLATRGYGEAMVVIEQAVLRYVGQRWNMPEYMISGDASNANYSSTMVAESPFVAYCESRQVDYVKRYRRIMWRVIEHAVESGRLKEFRLSYDEIIALVDVLVEPPQVAARDKDKETGRRKILHDDGLLSKKTWAGQEGEDYEREVENGAKAVAPPAPFGMPGSPVVEGRRLPSWLQRWEGYP